MLRRLGHTALHALPLVFGVLVLNFMLIQLLPGDAAEVYAGEAGVATREAMSALRERFGVDQPVITQLVAYLGNLAHFNLGYSVRYNAPVSEIILSRLSMTILLKLTALVFALILGVVLGVIMAQTRGKWPDRLLSLITTLFYSAPGFWVGLMLIVLFAVHLGWVPTDGYKSIGTRLEGLDYALDVGHHLILPALASSTFFIAIFARLTRSSLIEVSRQDHVRTAWAKGLSPRRVLLKHMLRNALIPLTTVTGMHVGALLGGAVVIETIFSWPGLGRLAYDAILAREYVVLLGILMISSFLVILANVLTDTLQAWLDPRIRE